MLRIREQQFPQGKGMEPHSCRNRAHKHPQGLRRDLPFLRSQGMLNSTAAGSPGRQHVPASESWVQTSAAPGPSFSPFLRGTQLKTGVSLLCKLSILQECKSWASHSPLPQSETLHSQHCSSKRDLCFLSPGKLKKVIAAGSHTGRSFK